MERDLTAGERLLCVGVICLVIGLLVSLWDQHKDIPPDRHGNNINALGRSLEAAQDAGED